MLIKSLRMENFRQFKGSNKIDFSTEPEKNVTVILGENTYGKTTLLQTFHWCFYGEETFAKSKNPDKLLNLEVAREMREGDTRNVEVEITVKHHRMEYTLTRTRRYTMNNGKVLGEAPQVKVSYRQSDGQTKAVRDKEVKIVINNILPQGLSTYFFFDTERVNTITDRSDVAEAVKGLLGLTILDNAIKHLGSKSATTSSVIGKYYANLDENDDHKAQEARQRMRKAEKKREAIAERLKECKDQIKCYEDRREQLNDILRDNRTTSELQKKKESFERFIAEEEKALKDAVNKFFKEFSKGALGFFVQPLLTTTSAFLEEEKVEDNAVRDLTGPAIQELLDRGRCICGAEIRNGNDAYNHLKELKTYVPPESIGNTVRYYREQLKGFSRPAEGLYESLKERSDFVYRSKERIQDWEDELLEIGEQIKGKENMRKYEVEREDVKKRLNELNEKKDSLIGKEAEQKSDIDRAQKEFDNLVLASEKNKEIRTLMEYAIDLCNWLKEERSKRDESIRQKLETKVSEIFQKMYHGKRRVVIDEKYQVSLLAAVGEKESESGESEGLNSVKNFAFIAGLVALAKEKMVTDRSGERFDLSSEPYPLVMDAPFSNADETHTANISKVLPEIAEQVIMFVMDKDWKLAKKELSQRLGKQYQLNKISETCTRLQ